MEPHDNFRTSLRFFFDPTCPWAYRASLWLREVAELLPLEVNWQVFSLEYINRAKKDDAYLAPLRLNQPALRLLALAVELEGQAGIDALFLELGRARHTRGEKLSDEGVLARALANAGLPVTLLSAARENPALDARLETGYAEAAAAGVFGVPSLWFADAAHPFYGPLIERVPEGMEAVRLFEHVRALESLPYFYELKRIRG